MGGPSFSKPLTEGNRHTRRLAIYLLIGLSLAMSALKIAATLQHAAIFDATETVWTLVFIMLTILWAHCDARLLHFHEPFEFGFLAYLLWPLVLPWYLVTTHGVRGLFIFLGFVVIWVFPWLSAAATAAFIA